MVDALRGFALVGIILLHTIEHFAFFYPAELNPEIFSTLDIYVNDSLKYLFSGKSFSIFSLLFGFSFFIQMDRNEKRGINFRGRYLWRLVILFIFGYFFSLILLGEILTIYAVIGVLLIFLYRVNTKLLLGIAIIFFIQPLTYYFLFNSLVNPEYQIDMSYVGQLWAEAFSTAANGSLLDVITFNAWKGHLAIWIWAFIQGRLLQTFGLLILGLVVGKLRFFENINENYKLVIKLFKISLILSILFHTALKLLPELDMVQFRYEMLNNLIKSYFDLSFTVVLISLFIIIYTKSRDSKKFSLLANFGRMSLTNYVIHPIIGVPIFYGFGLGLYQYCGAFLSLIIGIIILIIQLYTSKYWLNKFRYGPLEWCWRILTFWDFSIKNKKSVLK